ncbi:hypothetical protein LOS22_10285 [Enterococcus faecium]|nr:hypothetical protein [Enterococcus faecium]
MIGKLDLTPVAIAQLVDVYQNVYLMERKILILTINLFRQSSLRIHQLQQLV